MILHYITSLDLPISLAQLAAYLPAALALNLTPGNDFLFCLGQGINGGPRAGIAASFGIATGSLIYTVIAAAGLAALLATYPIAFSLLRWAGIGYLIFIAVKTLRAPNLTFTNTTRINAKAWMAYRDGVLVNFLNPKVAIFILAFIPQFVNPENGSTIVQFLLLGAIFNITGTMVNASVGMFAGSLGRTVNTRPNIARGLQYLTGTIYLALAAKLALNRS